MRDSDIGLVDVQCIENYPNDQIIANGILPGEPRQDVTTQLWYLSKEALLALDVDNHTAAAQRDRESAYKFVNSDPDRELSIGPLDGDEEPGDCFAIT